MMRNIEKLLENVHIPPFCKVRYNISKDRISDIRQATLDALQESNVIDLIKPGSSVAITAGSREINNIVEILDTLIGVLKKRSVQPFIVPAMGSHGGATADGQESILAGLGITEKSLGVPVRASMETDKIGIAGNGTPVYVDRIALSADYIIPVGRIKPHTDFKGQFESGLMKMLAIGLGKQQGAGICHKLGMQNMSNNVLAMGREIIKQTSVPFGLGIIENALHETYRIKAIPGEAIERLEPPLLEQAKKLVPVVPFDKVDIIIMEEMGKDISGTGMDSNVIGRSASLGISRPFAERIGVLSLTGKSHGNANGMGLADAVTRRFFNSLRFDQTYPNAITSAETTAVKLPAVMETDEMCVKFLIRTCTGSDEKGIRIVWLRNTLSMNEFYISEGLEKEIFTQKDLSSEMNHYNAIFDGDGNHLGFG